MEVSTTFDTEKEIWHLGLSRNPGKNFLGPLKVIMNIVYFYMSFFYFAKRFLPLLTMRAFFRNMLPHHTPSNLNNIFYWFLLVEI